MLWRDHIRDGRPMSEIVCINKKQIKLMAERRMREATLASTTTILILSTTYIKRRDILLQLIFHLRQSRQRASVDLSKREDCSSHGTRVSRSLVGITVSNDPCSRCSLPIPDQSLSVL